MVRIPAAQSLMGSTENDIQWVEHALGADDSWIEAETPNTRSVLVFTAWTCVR